MTRGYRGIPELQLVKSGLPGSETGNHSQRGNHPKGRIYANNGLMIMDSAMSMIRNSDLALPNAFSPQRKKPIPRPIDPTIESVKILPSSLAIFAALTRRRNANSNCNSASLLLVLLGRQPQDIDLTSQPAAEWLRVENTIF